MAAKHMYIDMPFNDALKKKYDDGVAKHRPEPTRHCLDCAWDEQPPVFDGNEFNELFSEQLDVIHYCDFITEKYGKYGIDFSHRRQTAVAFALEIQSIHRNLEKFLTPVPGI